MEKKIEIEYDDLRDKLRSSLVNYFNQPDYNSWCFITQFVDGFMPAIEKGEGISSDDEKQLKVYFEQQRDIEKKAEDLESEIVELKKMSIWKFIKWKKAPNGY